MRVGVLADTHGLLRPETLDALAGCELLIHAGDVGKRSVLDALRELAPVVAVRGNVDTGDLATLPATEVAEAAKISQNTPTNQQQATKWTPGNKKC